MPLDRLKKKSKENYMHRFAIFVILSVAIFLPLGAHAASPQQTVEDHINQLLVVLGSKESNTPEQEEKKKDAIRTISTSLFDFFELSRFTLGPYWKRFNPEQQKTFVELYRKLLEDVYMGRLLQYKDEKVVYEKETMLTDRRAEVQTSIKSATGDIPMSYKMVLKEGRWKVYDVVIENVSLVKNYRSQFASLLAEQSPAQVLDILRDKVSG
jgi:phospholipid transport system substrate-binding protein